MLTLFAGANSQELQRKATRYFAGLLRLRSSLRTVTPDWRGVGRQTHERETTRVFGKCLFPFKREQKDCLPQDFVCNRHRKRHAPSFERIVYGCISITPRLGCRLFFRAHAIRAVVTRQHQTRSYAKERKSRQDGQKKRPRRSGGKSTRKAPTKATPMAVPVNQPFGSDISRKMQATTYCGCDSRNDGCHLRDPSFCLSIPCAVSSLCRS